VLSVTFVPADAAAFASVSAAVTINVTPAPLTVTADAQTKTAGSDDPQFSFQITSGAMVQGDTLTGQLSRLAGEGPGSYSILQGTLTAGADYALTFVSADLTITAAPAGLCIGGRTLRDLRGNGKSADDVGLGGVTVRLFMESDGNRRLDHHDRLILTAISDATGAYLFENLAPGRYYVKEVRPEGYVRTAPRCPRYYAVDLISASIGGLDFDNFKGRCIKFKHVSRPTQRHDTPACANRRGEFGPGVLTYDSSSRVRSRG
jgi:hypothetical protein